MSKKKPLTLKMVHDLSVKASNGIPKLGQKQRRLKNEKAVRNAVLLSGDVSRILGKLLSATEKAFGDENFFSLIHAKPLDTVVEDQEVIERYDQLRRLVSRIR